MDLRKTSTAIVGALLALLVCLGGGHPAVAVGPGPELALGPAADGVGLAWAEGSNGGVVVLDAEAARPIEVTWDLRELDPAAYRHDLVHVEVVSVEGAGLLTVHAEAAHGRRAVVVDRASRPGAGGGSTMVLQAGRMATQRWYLDRAGAHRVVLRASVARPDGTAAVTATADPMPAGGTGEGRSATSVIAESPPRPGGSRADAAVVIADGHVDIGPRIIDGHWRVQVKDDTVTPQVWRELSDVVLHASDAARTSIPDRPAYAFLGDPGTPYHILPQVQRGGIVWPGWNSQDPSVMAVVPGPVTWRLRGVEGPGRFVLFVTDSFGDIGVLFDTDDPMPQDLAIAPNSHVHGSWAFDAPGVYRLAVEMRATAEDGSILSDVRPLTVVVGEDVDPSTVSPGDDGGPGQAVPSGGGGGPEVSISTDLPRPGEDDPDQGEGVPPASGGGGGPLAQTGITVAPFVVVALGLVLGGWVVRGRVAHLTRNETHS